MQPPASPVPPGWYPDPWNPAVWRWWDGTAWTGHVQPVQAAPGAQQWAPGAQQWVPDKATTTPDGVPLAGLGARLLARIVDSLLLGVAQVAVMVPFVPAALRSMIDYIDTHQQDFEQGTVDPFALYGQPEILRLMLVAVVATTVISAVYTVTFIRLRGATPGKLVAGVRVRPWQSEGRPSWAQATQRWATGELLGALLGIYALVDYLWPCWDDRRQALHDKWPGTVVVTDRRP